MDRSTHPLSTVAPRKVRVNSTPPHILFRLLDLLAQLILIICLYHNLIDAIHGPPFAGAWIYWIAMFLIMILCLWTIYAIFTGRRYHGPRENRKLCESGVLIEGRFTGRRRNLNDGIWYTFTHPTTGEIVERLAIVYNKQAAAKLEVGDSVWVLYGPNNLKKSTVYETCGYEVVGGLEAL